MGGLDGQVRAHAQHDGQEHQHPDGRRHAQQPEAADHDRRGRQPHGQGQEPAPAPGPVADEEHRRHHGEGQQPEAGQLAADLGGQGGDEDRSPGHGDAGADARLAGRRPHRPHQPVGAVLVETLPGPDVDGGVIGVGHDPPEGSAGPAGLVEEHGAGEGRVGQGGEAERQPRRHQRPVPGLVVGHGRRPRRLGLGLRGPAGPGRRLGLGPQPVPPGGDRHQQLVQADGDLVQRGARAVDDGHVGQAGQAPLQGDEPADGLRGEQPVGTALEEQHHGIGAEGGLGVLPGPHGRVTGGEQRSDGGVDLQAGDPGGHRDGRQHHGDGGHDPPPLRRELQLASSVTRGTEPLKGCGFSAPPAGG